MLKKFKGNLVIRLPSFHLNSTSIFAFTRKIRRPKIKGEVSLCPPEKRRGDIRSSSVGNRGLAETSIAMKKRFKEELGKLGILIVYLFGSKATGRGSRLSDVDIGVVCKDSMQDMDTRPLYNRLYEFFSDLYPHSRLDIVFLQTATLALQFFAIRDGKVIFEGDPRFTVDYENRVIQQYLDFRPVLDFFDRIAAERYAET
jgi:predicted nucleotidyltransferase